MNPVHCDCLNVCGDDPWLADGKAMPCAYKKDRDKKLAEINDDIERLTALASVMRNTETGAALARVLKRLRP